MARDEAGELVGGVIGSTYADLLRVKNLWVKKNLRSAGFGRELMLKAEAEAKARGCRQAFLDTFDFQAP